ncbi:ATP-binding protein [Streptomyces sp. LP05-1]|uniref:ATP-binding protein n=1 Tax=Streptomyces pyxinae TaxID=2970734 RepID=A0ABT2CIG4_9ACTN|nr:ATP-binding protein [Streptomyces sp. LP05-1]MCS0637197.1 ATP-binding protein [Streptomyces sp. LP05-1]
MPPEERDFDVKLAPTPHGARAARLLAVARLGAWEVPEAAVEAAALIVAELAANAFTHGRLPGRDFRLALKVPGDGRVLRIEVTDTRAERLPGTRPGRPVFDSESGRGLLLVDALASRWGAASEPVPRKTVWAELDLAPETGFPGSGEPGRGGPGGPSGERNEREETQLSPAPPARTVGSLRRVNLGN